MCQGRSRVLPAYQYVHLNSLSALLSVVKTELRLRSPEICSLASVGAVTASLHSQPQQMLGYIHLASAGAS